MPRVYKNISKVVLSSLDYRVLEPLETYKAYDCEECFKHRKFTVLEYNMPDKKSKVKCNGCGAEFIIERYM